MLNVIETEQYVIRVHLGDKLITAIFCPMKCGFEWTWSFVLSSTLSKDKIATFHGEFEIDRKSFNESTGIFDSKKKISKNNLNCFRINFLAPSTGHTLNVGTGNASYCSEYLNMKWKNNLGWRNGTLFEIINTINYYSKQCKNIHKCALSIYGVEHFGKLFIYFNRLWCIKMCTRRHQSDWRMWLCATHARQ